MPATDYRIITLIIIASILPTALCGSSASLTITKQKSKTFSETQLKVASGLSAEELTKGLQKASSHLLSASVNFHNYDLIKENLDQIAEIAEQQLQTTKTNKMTAIEAKAKFFQLISLISENTGSKMVFTIGNLYRFTAVIFNWHKSAWKEILAKYRKEQFKNYIKHSLELPFTRLAKILAGILVCIKLVDFIKDPGKTFSSKSNTHLVAQTPRTPHQTPDDQIVRDNGSSAAHPGT